MCETALSSVLTVPTGDFVGSVQVKRHYALVVDLDLFKGAFAET